jgi:hypothetical protein
LFSDFLEMAAYLLKEEQLKQPAAVLAGGVLEEHIRKLSELNGISCSSSEALGAKAKKLDALNSELAKANVYGKNDQKQITAWCGIRNSAAHAHYDEFDDRPGQCDDRRRQKFRQPVSGLKEGYYAVESGRKVDSVESVCNLGGVVSE